MATPAGKKSAASKAVDAQLKKYRSMRDFKVTAEPSGAKKSAQKSAALPFVIQKHAATRLHYDFRLGWDGVLKSWAVTKGPSYFPGDKRLAVQVEDHPMDYGGFEGTIPKGQYGGGTVMVWDNGTWEPQAASAEVDEALKKGSLKFILHGHKLKGKWALIRMGGHAAQEGRSNWLLIKEHDEYERSANDEPITESEPDSVLTKRNLEQIGGASDHVWQSKPSAHNASARVTPESAMRERLRQKLAAGKKIAGHKMAGQKIGKEKKSAATAPAKRARPASKKKPASRGDDESAVASAPRERTPQFISPQLASQATTPPTAGHWVHELKLDGYRIQARVDLSAHRRAKVALYTRKGLDWAHRMPAVVEALESLPIESAVFDGEVVVLDAHGQSSFADLQSAFQEHVKKPLKYFIFDLLHLNGHNLRGLQLTERKRLLEQVLAKSKNDVLVYSQHLEADGTAMFHEACRLGAEGIVSKNADAAYFSGRSDAWVKVKCGKRQEFVIAGFTHPSNGSSGIGALLLGYYENGKLIYAGRTGTGFTHAQSAELRKRLEKIKQKDSPFADVPRDAKKGAFWVEPKLVGEVAFATWTSDNLVRQASFKGLREDKPAKEVRREVATPPPSRPRASAAAPATHAAKRFTKKSAPAPSTTKKSAAAPAAPRLTNPDKILDAASGLTKQKLFDYFQAAAPLMLPYIVDRPVSIVRCPAGAAKPCFFQKHIQPGLPAGVASVMVADKKGGAPEPYITLPTVEAIANMAQLGVMEIHPWGSRNDDLEKPDRIIFDLDPDASITWPQLQAATLDVRKRLKKLGIECFVKTTGGKGIHVVVSIKPEHQWPEVKEFTHAFVAEMETSNPKLYLTKMSKAARKGKIFLDYLRNERGATSVAAYSPRARAGANVSMPLTWTEFSKLKTMPHYPAADFTKWRDRLRRDPWKDLDAAPQSISG
jgi:bifunctional non-homologous end joining protein LigD